MRYPVQQRISLSRTMLVVVPILAASLATAEEPAAKKGGGAKASGVSEETSALKIAKVLGDNASPALRWVETERLKACCGHVRPVKPLPELTLKPIVGEVKQEDPCELMCKGETIIRVLVAKGEKLGFQITAGATSSPFSDSTYAIFAPDGKHLSDGIVKQGESKDVSIPTLQEGLFVVYFNSGPASDNSLSLRMNNRFWVVDGRGRSAYIGTPVSLNSLRDLSLAGFNTALVAAWSWGIDFSTDEGLDRWVQKIEPWAEAAKRYNMRLIPYVGWACGKNEMEAAGEYRKNISTRQIDGPRPCPLSQEYWDRTFLRRAMAVARLSKRYPSIIGFGFDPESYYFHSWYGKEYKKKGLKKPGWHSVVFFSNDECFCDHCFFGFLESRGLARPEVAADGKARSEWLENKGLTKNYYKRLDDELCALTTRLREKVHAVNPDLVFAVMLLGHTGANYHWWCSGASRGLGTPRLPVFDYDEMTYGRGFTPVVERHKERFAQWGAHVVHGGALIMYRCPPQDPRFLSAQMYHFAVRDSGYWIYPIDAFFRNLKHSRRQLAGYQEDYWKAFVLANREIERKLKQGDSYVSELNISLKQPPPPPETDKDGQNVWHRKPFYSLRAKSGTKLSFYVPKGKKGFTLICGAREKGGRWKITVTSPEGPATTQELLPDKTDETIEIDVSLGEQEKPWTVQVEKAGTGGSQCLGIGAHGLPPFFSSCTSTLLVPETP